MYITFSFDFESTDFVIDFVVNFDLQ